MTLQTLSGTTNSSYFVYNARPMQCQHFQKHCFCLSLVCSVCIGFGIFRMMWQHCSFYCQALLSKVKSRLSQDWIILLTRDKLLSTDYHTVMKRNHRICIQTVCMCSARPPKLVKGRFEGSVKSSSRFQNRPPGCVLIIPYTSRIYFCICEE